MAIGCLETHNALWRQYSGWRQVGQKITLPLRSSWETRARTRDEIINLAARRSEIYQWASSRLFIPRGDNVFPLCIKWASRAFLTASRFLRMSSSGIRMTSLIECPASLKCKETGVGSLRCWWFRMDQRSSLIYYTTWSPIPVTIYCFYCDIFKFLFVTNLYFYFHFSFSPWRRFVSNQNIG